MKTKNKLTAINTAILIAILISIILVKCKKPEVFIIREYNAETLQGYCKIVDYTIGGYATSAVFYNYEDGVYEDFMRMLEKEGRITR